MSGQLIFRYTIDGDDFTRAGEASSSVKNKLKMLGLSADVTRRVAIAMYEGEINMVIHADGGEITVTVSDSEITMVLADTGPGIPEPEQARIFSRFYRSPSAWQQEGVGIGLYLTREILKKEDGYVKVKSKPGKGAEFMIYLHKGR